MENKLNVTKEYELIHNELTFYLEKIKHIPPAIGIGLTIANLIEYAYSCSQKNEPSVRAVMEQALEMGLSLAKEKE